MSPTPAAAHLDAMTDQHQPSTSRPGLPTLSYTKTLDTRGVGTITTYDVLLDGHKVGTVSKVRDHYLRHLGGHRGNNVPAARNAWRHDKSSVNYDTRGEAVIDLIDMATDLSRVEAMDIVRAQQKG